MHAYTQLLTKEHFRRIAHHPHRLHESTRLRHELPIFSNPQTGTLNTTASVDTLSKQHKLSRVVCLTIPPSLKRGKGAFAPFHAQLGPL